jgi:hypothetical protein
MTSKVYESIKARAPEDIHLNIKAILVFHVGADNAISKEDLSRRMFKKYTSSTDRQIRDAVAELVIYFDEPIVTNTVTGGFYYAGTPDEIDQNIADLLSRSDQFKLRVEGLRRARVKRFPRGYGANVTAQGRLL